MELYKKQDSLASAADYSVFLGLIKFWNKSVESDDGLEKIEMPNDLKSAFDILQIAKD
jgi:hypothetical protein